MSAPMNPEKKSKIIRALPASRRTPQFSPSTRSPFRPRRSSIQTTPSVVPPSEAGVLASAILEKRLHRLHNHIPHTVQFARSNHIRRQYVNYISQRPQQHTSLQEKTVQLREIGRASCRERV